MFLLSGTGAGGAGSSTNGVGTTVYAGGSGSGGAAGYSGAGGGGAGSGGAGGSASGAAAGTGTATGGGNGGAGLTATGIGNNGYPAGGGGSGGYASGLLGTASGGDGADGQVTISWKPSVVTGAATSITGPSAVLNGTVTYGGPTAASFQYGLDTNYGSTATASQSPLDGSATNAAISQTVTGLACEKTYHFRAYATNIAGSDTGSDATFTTPTCGVQLGKTGPVSGLVGSYVTFIITATNANATTPLSNIVVTDAIPDKMSYSTHAASMGVASLSGTTLTWTIGYLPPSTTASLTLVVKLTARGTVWNTVSSPGAAPASARVVVLPGGIVHYRMDEAVDSWNGTDSEVKDWGPQGLNGTRTLVGTAATATNTKTPTGATNTVPPGPSISAQYPSVVGGGFCNAAYFDGKAVVKTPTNSFFQFSNTLSASAWIYLTAYPPDTNSNANDNLYSILSNDVNYEFHVNSDGKLYWWWQFQTSPTTTQAYWTNSSSVIPLNKWTHVAITFDSSTYNRQTIYINGVQDRQVTGNPAGTLVTNKCPMYVGGDIYTSTPPGQTCTLATDRAFHGMIDEAKIYDYELSADEVKADMIQGHLCSGTYDHVRIEYNGKFSKCGGNTVTVKACMDSGCTALYPGAVQVTLTPSGWLPQDTVAFSSGMTQLTFNNAAVSGTSMTLGGTNVSPVPNSNPKVRCFNGTTENCVVQVDNSACTANFDAVEPTKNPRTNLFTKLAGTAFNIDLVAVRADDPTSIDPNFVGTINYDLVDSTALDAGAATCQNSASLLAAQPIQFTQADQGRKKNVAVISASAVQDGRMRMTLGGSPACSTDNFAVRPPYVTLATTQTPAATPPLATDPATLKATDYNPATGNTLGFTLKASASAGYAGTLVQDAAKLSVQDPTSNIVAATTKNVGSLVTLPQVAGTSTLTANATSNAANAAYNEVGYLYLAAGAYIDKAFTGVDSVKGDCVTDTANGNNLSNVLDGAGKFGCDIGSQAASIGRFIPDHFATVAVGTMNCPAGLTCPSGSGIAYSAQPLAPAAGRVPLKVIAASSGGTTTQNYAGLFASDGSLAVFDAPGSTATANAGKGVLSSNAVAAAAFNETKDAGGNVTKTGGVAWVSPTYTFNAWPTSPTDVYFRATAAADGITSLQSPAANSVEGGIKFVTGRLRISNSTGPETQPLALPVQMQYWGGLTWLPSTTDNTSLSAGSVFLVAPPSGKSVFGKTSVASVTQKTQTDPVTHLVSPIPGSWLVTLAQPGAHNVGSVDLTINLGNSGSDTSCLATHGGTPAGIPWLRGSCPGQASGADPSARATFGIYSPENRRQVHVRELY
ncbi:MAG TPA: DUF6701 domain-containing protein [Rhodocyclaceae bacterium]